MNEVEERVSYFLDNVLNYHVKTFDSELYQGIINLLKEQDKLTRHACAEAVLNIASHDGYDKDGVLVQTSRAHDACINTKAV